MPKLTRAQLRELRIFNQHDFAYVPGGWCLYYVPHSRFTMSSLGWWIMCPTQPACNTIMQSHRVRVPFNLSRGNTHPNQFEEYYLEVLQQLGLAKPAWLVRFMGAWWDADFYEMRMAELVAQYKAYKQVSKP